MIERCEYPPGHPEAVKLGCRCPTGDSGLVDAYGYEVRWYSDDCPMHGGDMAKPMGADEMVFGVGTHLDEDKGRAM